SGSSVGYAPIARGAGVANVVRNVAASAVPVADRVPAGISSVYSVAIGRRSTGTNRSVRVSSHVHRPGGSGVSRAGGSRASVPATVVSGTIGWLNVIVRCGARSVSPVGTTLTTSSARGGSGVAGAGRVTLSAGKPLVMTMPVRGGGGDAGGNRNSVELVSGSAGSRASSAFVAAADSGAGVAAGNASPGAEEPVRSFTR